ncbi:MAG: PAS domain S-box protein [Pseudomonadota bacterium]
MSDDRLIALANAATRIHGAPSLSEALDIINEEARLIVGAHQSVTCLTIDATSTPVIHSVSLSEKYARWADYREPTDGSGIYALVCRQNRPIRLTQAELERHPAWRHFGAAKERHPPMRGWLAVPLVSRDGGNLGIIQLSDRYDGDFTEADEAILVQLAQMASIAVEKTQLLDAARAAEARYRRIVESSIDVICMIDRTGNLVDISPSCRTLWGYEPEEMIGRLFLDFVSPEDRDRTAAAATDAIERNIAPPRFENRHMRKDGSIAHVQWSGTWSPEDQLFIVVARDMTERLQFEERLRQSQRLEAIGQLTGGVAHDFNNLLTVILGNAELLTERLTDQPRLKALAQTSLAAAERGAELTNRLLAFSRRQALEPRIVDVTRLLDTMEELLRRTLGEHIDVVFAHDADLPPATVDPTQLETAILNLALNARDAMPDGGRLTIEMANVHIDEARASRLDELSPGDYVMIAVSDTGTGMPPAVRERAFEPFFTTKGVGKGSGLGLSMVYGFMKQSGGHVSIYSEPGHGTCVKLFLPRSGEADRAEPVARATTLRGTETVLVVEDDDLVRAHVERQLTELGYRVFAVADGQQALETLRSDAAFDLLFTDMVMPGGMNGKQLADEAWRLRPGLKVLFTSGYTESTIIHRGRLDPGIQLLNKPYRLQDLATKIRLVLSGEGRP